ncbi:AraC-type DNA-binding protein [Tangfeifania diversioriginum]|uniref:AraC-type DNA-binding protein n=1 Tax=Tangfeifania diversioriginum TaxID=1168035 RepID=A0A1M6M3P8_9BACT|nr:helix-turn-helix domain-containing protein [Tangfeifania diversioriginum]SHJ78027.1 AraC-type DNA-binding protein [Tangfeifania diversioriginum]
MYPNEVFSNTELTEDEFAIALTSNKLPLNSALAKAGKCIICYCLNGEAEIEVNLTKHRFVKSEIMVIFPSQIVEQKKISPDFLIMYFTLAPHILQEVTFRFPPSFLNFLHYHFYYRVGDETVKEEAVRFKEIEEKYLDTENFCRREILMNLLRIFFLELFDKIRRDELTQSGSKHNRKAEIYEKFCNLVMRTYKRNRDVKFYADALSISSKYLSIITMEHSSFGAKQWIDDYAILELKVRLKSTSDSFQKIADEFNFSDLAFMSKYFKSRVGISPSEFRKG